MTLFNLECVIFEFVVHCWCPMLLALLSMKTSLELWMSKKLLLFTVSQFNIQSVLKNDFQFSPP